MAYILLVQEIIVYKIPLGGEGVYSQPKVYNVVTDGIMTLRASNQVLCNVWSYDFYDLHDVGH